MPDEKTPQENKGQSNDSNGKENGIGSLFKMDGLVSGLNGGIRFGSLLGALILLLVIAFLQWQNGTSRGHPIVFLMIAAAAFGGGILLGLMMTAFGEEKQMFSNLSAAFHGILGGFTLADLTKSDSVIKKILHSLAAASGNRDDLGLTSAVVVFFGGAGFVTMFFNKQYILNPMLANNQQTAERLEKLQQITKCIRLPDFSWESTLEITAEQKDQLEKAIEDFHGVLDDAALMQELSLETLRSYAKAYRLLGEKALKEKESLEADKKFREAEKILHRARCKSPDDATLLLDLANVMLLQERYDLAADIFSRLTRSSSPCANTYKLLGYAGLFYYRYLDEAEAATRKYLLFVPNDAGAKLNLACAIGQHGPDKTDQSRRDEMLRLLREAVHDWPKAGPIAAGLTSGDDDFVTWKDDEEFKKITAPFTKPT